MTKPDAIALARELIALLEHARAGEVEFGELVAAELMVEQLHKLVVEECEALIKVHPGPYGMEWDLDGTPR